MLTLLALIAVLLYAVATFWQWQRVKSREDRLRAPVIALGLIAWALHSYTTTQQLVGEGGTDLSLFNAGSLIAATVTLILILSSLRQKLDNLFIGVFPMAAITLAASTWIPSDLSGRPYEGGVISHILLSILAYSVLTLAAFQAILLAFQERALRQHHTRGLLGTLPPLQVMERLLFDTILAGVILLTLALITGFIFTEDLFAQHLAHKTLLSIVSWCVFVTLLVGRVLLGWRGRTALRWTMAGFALLLLAFFGSKAVLELIIGG